MRYRYSRRLLQRINTFEEEVAAVKAILLQQRKVLEEFRGKLEPATFEPPSTVRNLRFEFEEKGIQRVLALVREQLGSCEELQKKATELATRNLQLIETKQDDNGRAIFIFTFITVLFLPLSFVAGFFGMNLQGLADNTSDSSLFWSVAVPVTGVIMLFCFAIIRWGESWSFAYGSMKRYCKRSKREESL